eukprot:TRINITY_DN2303_c0_g1_i3.p1 TRINITY_DN2303_c0_g1~~TRINITY_DN2303_c0_g1_i3.p1  ORF type:complete len:585 (+),score=126.23 TRINITY_DN2303_c0_g1_i3:67-1755(+)
METAEIPASEIHYDPKVDLITEGAFGKVFQAEIKGTPVAIKQFREEVSMLRSTLPPLHLCLAPLTLCTRHPQEDLPSQCACTSPIILVFEKLLTDLEIVVHYPSYAPVELKSYLACGLPLPKKLQIAHETALGVSWLHGITNMVHRDLKPANLLLDEKLHVKVADFGFAELFRPDNRQAQLKGTEVYTAPECWRCEPSTKAADVYSFGLVLWELYTGANPYEQYCRPRSGGDGSGSSGGGFDRARFIAEVVYKGFRPQIPQTCPPALRDLMCRCWADDPLQRPSMAEVRHDLEHLIVQSCVASAEAQDFWLKHFHRCEEKGFLNECVTWKDFRHALADELGLPPDDPLLKKLQQIICPNITKGIDLLRFDMLSKWFGTFFTQAGVGLIKEMGILADEDWFARDAPRDRVEQWLTDRDDGFFFVRLSSTDPAHTPFTLSKRKNNATVHRRIRRLEYGFQSNPPHRYCLETSRPPVFARTLVGLVEQLQRAGAVTEPCPRDCLSGYGPSSSPALLPCTPPRAVPASRANLGPPPQTTPPAGHTPTRSQSQSPSPSPPASQAWDA